MNDTTVGLRFGVASNRGSRERNEDSYVLDDRSVEATGPTLAVLGVADGMGGHEAGDLASRLAIEVATAHVRRLPGDTDALRRAFDEVDGQIRAQSSSRDGERTMGTTLTLAVVGHQATIVGHVGDSRAYLFHDQELQQVTVDHSRVGRLVRTGVIPEDEAVSHPEGNVLEQALGVGRQPKVDVYRVGMGPGDIMLLSTDGLHGFVPVKEIKDTLLAGGSMQNICDRLVERAFERASDDNITVVAWQYPPPRPPAWDAPRSRAQTLPPTRATPWSPAGRRNRGERARLVVLAFVVGFVVGFVLRWIGT